MSIKIERATRGKGQIPVWSMQGALIDFNATAAVHLLALKNLVDASASGDFSQVELSENDPFGWRTDSLLTTSRAGLFLFQFNLSHPKKQVLTTDAQADIGDLFTGVQFVGDAGIEVYASSDDSGAGATRGCAFSVPFQLAASKAFNFTFENVTAQINQDFIVRAAIYEIVF
ncbi:hypothetical protein LCGC14_2698670 [marine sediment metagenome]|uniref:Uncharacterized protein n=1 Tax=marine sediment metagenome TaxID=412755 RepID=A0A0F9A3Z2_9ZZZZ